MLEKVVISDLAQLGMSALGELVWICAGLCGFGLGVFWLAQIAGLWIAARGGREERRHE